MPYPGFKGNRNKNDSEPRSWREGVGEQDKVRRKEQVDTIGQTENFFTANIRLIAALSTIAVLLALIGPWSIFKIKEWYETKHAEAIEVLITEQELEDLVARGPSLNWVDFDGYTYEVIVKTDYSYICQYDVEGGRYYLWVTSQKYGAKVELVQLFDLQSNTVTEIKSMTE